MHSETRTVQRILNPRQKSTLALILLLIASFAGNQFSLPLFFGIDFLFGSIAVLLVFQLYGINPGILAAAIASVQTFLIWNHPYGGIIFFIEALFVSLICQRRRANLVLIDGIYWLFIGIPLCWLFYRGFLQVGWTPTLAIALKQGVNGIFNALLVSLILTYCPLPVWVGHGQKRYNLSLQQMLFNLLVAFVFFPTLIVMAAHNWQSVQDIEFQVVTNLNLTASEVINNFQKRHELRVGALTELAKLAQQTNIQPSPVLQQSTQLVQQTFVSLRTVAILDGNDRAIAMVSNKTRVSPDLTCSTPPFISNQSWLSDGYTNSQGEASLRLYVPIPPEANASNSVGCAIAEMNLVDFSQSFPSRSAKRPLHLMLIDRRNYIIASTDPQQLLQQYQELPSYQKELVNEQIVRWMPSDPTIPALNRWQQSLYVLEEEISPNLPWRLRIEAPALPYITTLQNQYIKNLTILILLTILAFNLATWISRRLVFPLSQLAQVTTNLPDKLVDQTPIIWPIHASIREIDLLVENFQVMAGTLYQKFQEIQRTRETLEQHVEERTYELSQTNEALQRSYSFLKAQQEAAIDGILAVDENRAVTSYNLRFCQMWNISTDTANAVPLSANDVTDLLNSVIANLLEPERFSRRIEELSLEPTAIAQELLYLQDGRVVEYYSAPVFSADEQFYGRIWYFRDITERYLAAEELKRSYKALSDVHYALDQSAIVSTTDAEGTIVYVNDKFCESCQYPRAEIIRKTYLDLLDSKYHDIEFCDQLWQVIKRGEIWHGETKNRTRTGSSFWLNTTIVPFVDEDNHPFQYLSIAFDITERKRAEEELKAFAAKLEQSNRELQDFAYVASHDLQEPLRKIQAFSDRLASKYSSDLNEQAQDYINRMQNAALRMQTLIQDLLSFSRITTKAQPYSPVNLIKIAQEVLDDLEMRLEQTQGQVILHTLPTIEADPLQIRQLLQNLISNALKFHRPGVPPIVEVSAQLLPENTEFPQHCQIQVQDNGIGFDPKYVDRIFNIFQRLHGRNHYEGTGVGLAICRKIVERHGGQITATSQPEQGTTFIITLPVKQSNS